MPRIFAAPSRVVILLAMWACANAQSTATLQGSVSDPSGAILGGAKLTAVNNATGVTRTVKTDGEGNYQIAALPVGIYRIKFQARGFQPRVVEALSIEIGRTLVLDFQLRVGDISQKVTVTPAGQLIERATVSVGHVIGRRMVQSRELRPAG